MKNAVLAVELTSKGRIEAEAHQGEVIFVVPFEEALQSTSLDKLLLLEEKGFASIDIGFQPKIEQHIRFNLKMGFLSNEMSKTAAAWNKQREIVLEKVYALVTEDLKEEFGQLLLNQSRTIFRRHERYILPSPELSVKRARCASLGIAPPHLEVAPAMNHRSPPTNTPPPKNILPASMYFASPTRTWLPR